MRFCSTLMRDRFLSLLWIDFKLQNNVVVAVVVEAAAAAAVVVVVAVAAAVFLYKACLFTTLITNVNHWEELLNVISILRSSWNSVG